MRGQLKFSSNSFTCRYTGQLVVYVSASENMIRLRAAFKETSSQVNLRGILGVTKYEPVYNSLMQIQKNRLMEIAHNRHNEFMKRGYFISFAYAYPDGIVDNIGVPKNGEFDKEAWNIYSKWYTYLNKSLDITSQIIADSFNGMKLKATASGIASQISQARAYSPMVVSHRVHAELSGIGWRGKNGLIVNPKYSCMIRLSGVISSESLLETIKTVENCGKCSSCLEICPFIRHKDKLDDYRDQCLVYMKNLALDDEVCGKCIKACINSPKMNTPQKPSMEDQLYSVFYTLP